MAKRRKKRNNAANSQPSTSPDVDIGSEQTSATTTEPQTSVTETASSETVALAASSSGSSTGFLQGTKEELEKVVWPDRQQLISESIAVFLMVSLSAIIISFIDNLFRWVSTLVFG